MSLYKYGTASASNRSIAGRQNVPSNYVASPSSSYGLNGAIGNTGSSYLLGDYTGRSGIASAIPNIQTVNTTMPQYEVSNQRMSDLTTAGGTPVGVEPGTGFDLAGTMGTATAGISALADVGSAWAAWEGVQAAKDANRENAAMNKAQFNLSLDEYQRQVDRQNNLGEALARNYNAAGGNTSFTPREISVKPRT
jgi:hypothetical protein